MSRRLATAALALAGLAFALPARAQTPPEPPPPQSQVIVVLPPGSAPPPAGPSPQYYAPPAAPQYYAPPAAPQYYYAPQYYAPPAAPQYYAPASPLDQGAIRQDGFTMKLWAGPAYRRLFDLAIEGADVGVAFGGEHRGSVWSGSLGALFARTDQGLATYQLRPGVSWEAHIDRVRLGLGMELSWLGIQRATTGDLMSGFSIGGQVFGTVDLVQSGKHALYLGAKMSAEAFTTSGGGDAPLLWGPSAMVGWRY